MRDQLCFGETSCAPVQFLGVFEESTFPFGDLPFDGILGLSLPQLSAAPAFNVAANFAPTKFTFLLGDGKAGRPGPEVLVDKEPDEALHLQEPLRWVKTVDDDQGYWSVGIDIRSFRRTSSVHKQSMSPSATQKGVKRIYVKTIPINFCTELLRERQ